ncbi:MAG: DUF423 domain-containing protein [Bacteroidota bacterium]
MMKKLFSNTSLLMICGVLGALAVILGAFGAHGLKNVLPADKLTTYSTGVTYHFFHVLALLGSILLNSYQKSIWLKRAALFFITGILFFSGSLYLLSTREIIGLTTYRWLGPITPIGGVFFILGWLSISMSVLQRNDKKAA